MQNRIDRLEGLVLSLMTNGAQSAGPAAAAAAISRSQSDSAGSSSFPLDIDRDDDDMIKEEEEGEDSDVDGVTNSLGILKVDADKGKSLYFGDSHWHLVLADVSVIVNILYLQSFCPCLWTQTGLFWTWFPFATVVWVQPRMSGEGADVRDGALLMLHPKGAFRKGCLSWSTVLSLGFPLSPESPLSWRGLSH